MIFLVLDRIGKSIKNLFYYQEKEIMNSIQKKFIWKSSVLYLFQHYFTFSLKIFFDILIFCYIYFYIISSFLEKFYLIVFFRKKGCSLEINYPLIEEKTSLTRLDQSGMNLQIFCN